ncbi:hypothetical protein [Chitinophaga flava]|uniref:Uncharacterized protein n=1 Tax=Chitinophaga flava TaxID=2259036 RepID=A0A365XPS3_9BACT|nr:hypothetical protein [Chitinophaga flava]RBL88353.1 hypothetical protein DF182_17310 [Chitinophaga flava]
MISELSSRFQTIDPVRFTEETVFLEFIQSLINEIDALQPKIVMREQKRMTTAEIIAKATAAPGTDFNITTPDAMENWLNTWHERKQGIYNFFQEDKNLLHPKINSSTSNCSILMLKTAK